MLWIIIAAFVLVNLFIISFVAVATREDETTEQVDQHTSATTPTNKHARHLYVV